jgi:translation initiation factor IF-3
VNRRIRVPEIRVINQDGQQLGVMPTGEALRIAEAAGLDLVEVSPKAHPPVCKIMDYGRFKYEKSKQAKEARKRQSQVIVKEVKFRPKTDDHDIAFKVKKVNKFLSEGNKVKLVVQFRGREIVHPETGQDILQRVIDSLTELVNIEQMPSMEGRRMIMLLGPKVGVVRQARPPSSSGPPPQSGE